MAWTPRVRWSTSVKAWRCDVGPKKASGRATPVYFRQDALGSIGPEDHDRAAAALAAYLAARDAKAKDIARRGARPDGEMLAQMYLQAREKDGARPRTIGSHAERLAKFLDTTGADGIRHGDRPADELRASDLLRWARDATRSGLSPHTVAGVVRSVRACWAWAARPSLDRSPERILDADPLDGVRPPPTRRKRITYCPRDLAAAFLDWLDARYRDAPGDTGRMHRTTATLLRLLYDSGARPGELARLEWSDLDLAAGIARLDPARHKTGSKTGKDRVIPLSPSVVERLSAIADDPRRHPRFVFTHRRGRFSTSRGTTREHGTPWTKDALRHRWNTWRDEAIAAGIALPPAMTLYDFRRTFLTDAYLAGLTAEQAGQAAGTSARMVDQVYAQLQADQIRRVAESVRASREAKEKAPPGC